MPKTYCIPYVGAEVDVLRDQPLSQRAWTLQERALSPRALHLCTLMPIELPPCVFHARLSRHHHPPALAEELALNRPLS
jgi:hypothetical protein